jgi:hypothetical protein
MDWVNLSIGIIGVLATVSITLWQYNKGKKTKSIINARKEIIATIMTELSNGHEIQKSVIEILCTNIYTDCGISVPIESEIPIVIDEVITQLLKNVFLPSDKKQVLIDRVISIKNELNKKSPDINEARTKFEKLSTIRIAFRVFSLTWWGLTIGLILVIAGVVISVRFYGRAPDDLVFFEQLALVFISSLIIGFNQYRVLIRQRTSSADQLYTTLTYNVIEVINSFLRGAKVEQNVFIEKTKQISRADLVIFYEGEKIPIGIKHSKIDHRNIDQITNEMHEMESRLGILVTSFRLPTNLKELAKSRGIIVIENVNSANDIKSAINNTNFSLK